jgi:ADP-ribosylglycohydrolase
MSDALQVDKTAAVMLASAAGDALGWITELAKSQSDLEKRCGVTCVREFIKWEKYVGGRFQGYKDVMLPGDYSDDTQLTISTAACIRNDGTFDVTRFSKHEFPQWLEYARGAGGTIKEAASRIQRKSTCWYDNFFSRKVKEETLDYRDAGANGAAMRIAPHVLANVGRWPQAEVDIWRNTIISHGHPRAIVGALLYGQALDWLLQTIDDVSGRKLVEYLGQEVKGYRLPHTVEFDRWESTWNHDRVASLAHSMQTTIDEAVEYLRFVWRSLEFTGEADDVLKRLGCFAPSTKGSGLSTVLAGIYFFARRPEAVEENVLAGVNAIGADTDSIAAFVGGLAGAAFGLEALPAHWNAVQDRDLLVKLGRQLGDPSTEFDARPGRRFAHPGPPVSRKQLATGMRVFHDSLGWGQVIDLNTQLLLTKSKSATIARITFDMGQTCVFAFRADEPSETLYMAASQGQSL